jgi:hypothetical protein
MANIGHGGHAPVSNLHHDDLASIQIALSFIGVKCGETDQVDVEEKDTADGGSWSWEDKRIP